MIDLGAWASDQYAIPGKSQEADDSLELSQDEEAPFNVAQLPKPQ